MRLFGDRPRKGTHHKDRLNRILGVCHACGILWKEQRTVYHGQAETYRQELVRATDTVLITHNWEKYGLTVNPSVLERIKRMAPQFCYALNVSSVRVEVDGDIVFVCVPRDQGDGEGVVSFESAWGMAPDLGGSLLLGITDAGDQAVLDLRDASHPHCAVIGMTGSGKTTLLQTMLLSAEMTGQRVAILDPMGGLHALSGHPSVWQGGMYRRPDDIAAALDVLAQGRPADLFTWADTDGQENIVEQDRDLYVFIDEVPMLARRPGVADRLTEMAQVGRHNGVHLILGSQSATGIPALGNVAARLIGRVADRQASYFASGREGAGCETLRGKGDMVFVCGDVLQHFQAAMPGADLLDQWARRYPPRSPRSIPSPTPRAAPNILKTLQDVPAATVATDVEIAHGNLPGATGPATDPRMLAGIPRPVVREIRTYYCDHRGWPSLTWLEERHGYRRSVARRAINCAAAALAMPLPYPDWEREYSETTLKRLEVQSGNA